MVQSKFIILVEDEAIVVMDMKRRLNSAGYNISKVFATGEDVVEFVKGKEPDLILMDGRLAGEIDGIEAMRRVREMYPSIPIIFITGYINNLFFKQANELNPTAFLTKPVDFKKLLTCMDRVFKTSH